MKGVMKSAKRNCKIGHTTITWTDKDIEAAVKTISEMGFYGAETFGWVLDNLEKEGRSDLFKKYDIPLVSSYFSVDIFNPEKRQESMDKTELWGNLLVKHGCKVVTLGGNQVDRRNFNFLENKKYLVDTTNEVGKRLADKGIKCCFHPHTGTPVEVKDEIISFMDAVDTRYVKFAPDLGQIEKGGTDTIQIVKDYLSILEHVHLKDFKGGKVEKDENGKEIDSTGFVCYTPLGEGVVDIAQVMDILEEADFAGYVMVELDGGAVVPIPQEEALQISKNYLESLGYKIARVK